MIPEFISVLRWIRDIAYPAIKTWGEEAAASAASALASKDASAISETNAGNSETASASSASASATSAGESATSAAAALVSEEAVDADKISVAGDADYIRDARLAVGDPTGYNLRVPDELGIMELAVEDPLDSTKYDIHGIDQNNDNITHRSVLKVGALWGDGSAINNAFSHQLAQYPVDGITPVTWWIDGTKYTSDSIEVVQITPTTGKHFFYRDEIGLKELQNFSTDLFTLYAYTTSIYGNATTGKKIVFANERHGINLSGDMHKLHHMTEGTEYASGFGIVGLAAGSGVYTQIDSGRFFDEDIDRITPIQTNSPFWYLDGGDWTGVEDALDLGYITATYVNYNQNIAGNWQLTELGATDYMLIHVFSTNDVEFPNVKILGQATYNNTADARLGAAGELSTLFLAGLPAEEFIPLYTIIIDADGLLVLNDVGDLLTDWRQTAIVSSSGSSDTLPSQAGNANEFLQTDGFNAAWTDIDAYLGTIYEGL